jgi:hypothetical protein
MVDGTYGIIYRDRETERQRKRERETERQRKREWWPRKSRVAQEFSKSETFLLSLGYISIGLIKEKGWSASASID